MSFEEQLLKCVHSMNDRGCERLLGYAEELSENPVYMKDVIPFEDIQQKQRHNKPLLLKGTPKGTP